MKFRFLDSSLGLKFVILVAVVLSITMSSSAYYTILSETKKHTLDFTGKGNLLAEVISLISPEGIYAFDFISLNEHVKNISLKDDVIYCVIKDSNGDFLTSFINKDDPIIQKHILQSHSENLNTILPLVDQETNIITIKKEIIYEEDTLGVVQLGISTNKIIEHHDQSVKQQLFLNISVIIVLSVLIYSIFKQSALNRIKELIFCFESVAKGDLNQRVKIHNKDELSQLGTAFNEMIATLKGSIGLKELALNKIKELNKTLENKVQSRTEQLKLINDELFIQQEELRHHRDNLQNLVEEQMADIIKEKEKVEIASAAKTEFLANMSHELRTPLHAILSFSKFGLKKTDETSLKHVKNYFSKIEQSGNRLLNLVNNLLDLEKFESRKIELNLENVNFLDIYQRVNDEFDPLFTGKSLTIKLHCLEKSPYIICDKQKIEQVYRNIISNAVKFSNFGGEICIDIAEESENIKITVTDQGVGIPEEELLGVFDKFIQSSKTKNGSGGTGLGLPISKQIINLHGGKIAAESLPNVGAKFWFVLPKYGTE